MMVVMLASFGMVLRMSLTLVFSFFEKVNQLFHCTLDVLVCNIDILYLPMSPLYQPLLHKFHTALAASANIREITFIQLQVLILTSLANLTHT